MKYDPTREKSPLPYSPFKSCTVPRPIGWLSTISSEGVENLAPATLGQQLMWPFFPENREMEPTVGEEATAKVA